MTVTEEQVKHVAKLSELSFFEKELTDFTNQPGKIIDVVELLEKADITGVPFTSNVSESIDVIRGDVATPGMDRKELTRNVPELGNGYIKVSAITGSGGAGA